MAPTTITPELRTTVRGGFKELVDALQAHLQFNPDRSKGDYMVFSMWDFAHRSLYMIDEYDTIREGKSLRFPEQIKLQGTGKKEADRVFADACSRLIMLQALSTQPGVDYGARVNAAESSLEAAIPIDLMIEGMKS